jgi:type II secretory pathway pseudopilin PulG
VLLKSVSARHTKRVRRNLSSQQPCYVNMESSQFINQQRLSKKQLQLHLQQQQQQQQQQQNQKYYLDSSTNSNSSSSSTHDNYQQQQSRCQYFTSVTTPPTSHFPHPSEYATNHHHHQHHNNHQTLNHFASGGGSGDQMSPTSSAHRCCSNVKKYHHHQSESNNIEVCTIESQHSNHVGVVEPSSVSDAMLLNKTQILLFHSLLSSLLNLTLLFLYIILELFPFFFISSCCFFFPLYSNVHFIIVTVSTSFLFIKRIKQIELMNIEFCR